MATSTSKGSLFNFLHVGQVYPHMTGLCFKGHKQLTRAHTAIGPHTASISTKEGVFTGEGATVADLEFSV